MQVFDSRIQNVYDKFLYSEALRLEDPTEEYFGISLTGVRSLGQN